MNEHALIDSLHVCFIKCTVIFIWEAAEARHQWTVVGCFDVCLPKVGRHCSDSCNSYIITVVIHPFQQVWIHLVETIN